MPDLMEMCRVHDFELVMQDLCSEHLPAEFHDVHGREQLHVELIREAKRTSEAVLLLLFVTDKGGLPHLPLVLNQFFYNTIRVYLDSDLVEEFERAYFLSGSTYRRANLKEIFPNSKSAVARDEAWTQLCRKITANLVAKTDSEAVLKEIKPIFQTEFEWIRDNITDFLGDTYLVCRNFSNLDSIADQTASLLPFFDMNAEGGIKRDENMLPTLTSFLAAKISADHTICAKIPWCDGVGISPSDTEHANYLKEFQTRLRTYLLKAVEAKLRGRRVMLFKPPPNRIMFAAYREAVRSLSSLPDPNPPVKEIEEAVGHLEERLLSGTGAGRGHCLIVSCNDGAERTAFTAWLMRRWRFRQPAPVCVYRRIGLSPVTRSFETILSSVMQQLCCIFGMPVVNAFQLAPHEELFSTFVTMLEQIPMEQRIVLFVDDLHLLQETEWLSKLPQTFATLRLKMVATISDESEIKSKFQALVSSGDFLDLPHRDWQARMSHVTMFNTAAENLHIFRFLESCDTLLKQFNQEPLALCAYDDLLEYHMDFVEKLCTQDFVHQVCSLITAGESVFGLSGRELSDLLHLACMEEPNPATPTLLALVLHFLGSLIHETFNGEEYLMRWSCPFMSNYIRHRYGTSNQLRTYCMEHLFDHDIRTADYLYFLVADANSSSHGAQVLWKLELLDRLPRLCISVDPSILASCLEIACRPPETSGLEVGATELTPDYEETHETRCVRLIAKLLRQDAATAWSCPRTFLGRARRKLSQEGANEGISAAAFRKALNYYEGLPQLDGSGEASRMPNTEEPHIDGLLPLPGPQGERYCLALSTDSDRLLVYDYIKNELVRDWRNVPKPRSARFLLATEAVVACGRELHVYDLDRGLLMRQINGVLNLRMPLFEVVDREHVAVLSRDRLCLNMMSVATGQLEMAFKVRREASEDRFVNGLLVSSNGQYAVCGDETSQPFSLLVWDLKARKLIYDFRMVGHKFLTRLADISKDGRFLACAVQELEDPRVPNFLICYDLSSGQVYKKLTPDFDSSCVIVHSARQMIVLGLADSTLQVWDLLSGRMTFNLIGHSAPPDSVLLSTDGNRCASYSSLQLDPGIRLWDLVTGSCLATLVTSAPFRAVALAPGGSRLVVSVEGRRGLFSAALTSDDSHEPLEGFGDPALRGTARDVAQKGSS